MNREAELDALSRVACSAWLGVMAFVSIFHPSSLLTVEYGARALRLKDKKALHAWLVPLRLDHFLHRLRTPRHSPLIGTLLLILDPVQYELGPYLRWDKPRGLRQILAHVLVKDVLYRKRHRTTGLPALPDVRINALDDGIMGSFAYRRMLIPNDTNDHP